MNTSDDDWRYTIIRPERAGVGDLWRFWKNGSIESGSKFIIRNYDDDDHDQGRYTPLDIEVFDGKDKRWVIVVSVIMRKIIMAISKPMEWLGFLIEFILNLLALNGNLLALFFNILRGKVVIPQRGTTSFISVIGHLDGRIDLIKTDNLEGSDDSSLQIQNNRSLMDLCIMASKLAYENESVVQEIVVKHWKMHFVGFYNCWNDYEQDKTTQVFILCDKPVDAKFILISFRGTETFNGVDWSTDFDYSWYDIPGVGKLHMGFTEALGLGNRTDPSTFRHNLQETNIKLYFAPEMAAFTAYGTVKTKLKDLLKQHKNAKFIITGHSLGGALAILFPTVLVLHEENKLMERLLGVYTFGQPRIGNRDLGNFMEARINEPEVRYFRVVYCNDLVPRLPYDDETFLYKHFGVCLYYNSFYTEQKVKEEPNKNFYGMRYLIPAHMNAIWELIRAFTICYMYGTDYKEGWFVIFFRVIGLMLPGITAHSPRDYVNSVRLGRNYAVQMSPLD